MMLLFLLLACEEPAPPDQESYLERPPIFEICPSYQDKAYRVEDMIDWWVGINPKYQPEDIVYSDCQSKIEINHIRVEQATKTQLKEAEAVAFFSRLKAPAGCSYPLSGTGLVQLCYGTIWLPERVTDRVIAHEIGHAYGWEHSDQAWHVMNTNYTWWQTDGLEDMLYLTDVIYNPEWDPSDR